MAANWIETQRRPLNSRNDDDEGLPLVLIHRPPTLYLPSLTNRLSAHFRLLDPRDYPDQPTSSLLSSRAQSVRALICVGYIPVTSETLALLPSLELIVGTSAGLDRIDLKECKRRGITLTSTSVAFAEDVAEHAVALLIDVLRRISAANRFVRNGSWPIEGDYPLGFKLGGKRVGIVGLGAIGYEVATRLLAFGCRIAYNGRKERPSVPFPYYENVHDLSANSDILIISCALTEKTRHIVNKDVMTALGKGVIINVGRGALIDEKELVQFLVGGVLGGAGLDVFESEPYVPKELFALDNVVLTPHCAVLTPESMEAMEELVVTNLKAFFSNQPLQSVFQIE